MTYLAIKGKPYCACDLADVYAVSPGAHLTWMERMFALDDAAKRRGLLVACSGPRTHDLAAFLRSRGLLDAVAIDGPCPERMKQHQHDAD